MNESTTFAIQNLEGTAKEAIEVYQKFQEPSDNVIQDVVSSFCLSLSAEQQIPTEATDIIGPFLKEHFKDLLCGDFSTAFDKSLDEHVLILQKVGIPYFLYADLQNRVVDKLFEIWRSHLSADNAYRVSQSMRHIVTVDLTVVIGRITEIKKEALNDEKHILSHLMGKKLMVHLDGIINSLSELSASTDEVISKGKSTLYLASSFDRISDQFSDKLKSVINSSQKLSRSSDVIISKLSAGNITTENNAKDLSNNDEIIQSLSQAASKIGEVVKIINEIANQTNLLALNATIEAARAGNAGKGFSVVASEVKNLAGQTANATEEITLQINAMQDATSKVIESMEGLSKTVTKIGGTAVEVSSSIDHHSQVSNDILSSIQEVKDISDSIASMLQEVETATHETENYTNIINEKNMAVLDHCHYFKGILEKLVNYSNQEF